MEIRKTARGSEKRYAMKHETTTRGKYIWEREGADRWTDLIETEEYRDFRRPLETDRQRQRET